MRSPVADALASNTVSTSSSQQRTQRHQRAIIDGQIQPNHAIWVDTQRCRPCETSVRLRDQHVPTRTTTRPRRTTPPRTIPPTRSREHASTTRPHELTTPRTQTPPPLHRPFRQQAIKAERATMAEQAAQIKETTTRHPPLPTPQSAASLAVQQPTTTPNPQQARPRQHRNQSRSSQPPQQNSQPRSSNACASQ